MKYIRFQMISLGAFILTFVGASIFNIANGAPLLPLQILWINFAIDVLLAFGVGFDAPIPGLMERRPRPADQKVLPTPIAIRLTVASVLVSIATLGVVMWGEDRDGLLVATTMGLTVASLCHIVSAIEYRDLQRSMFDRSTVANGRFNMLVLGCVVLTYLATSLGALQRILDTVDLNRDHWRVVLIAVASYVVLLEIFEFFARRLNPQKA
jgi:Ca2+-transporting ATPase